MRKFLRSDLFRNWLGGFVVGVIGIVALQPAAGAEELKTRVHSAYSSIL